MSFRREIKSTLNRSKTYKLLSWIKANGGEILYPERTVNSIYFDNSNLEMYRESVEGVLPRKKIRLRIYKNENLIENFIRKSQLEYKISSVEGRFKISKKSFISSVSKLSIKDRLYGLCEPKLNVTYKRVYYKVNSIRLTIDKEIRYKKIKFKKIIPFVVKDNLNVVELKYKNENQDQIILNSVPFQFNRFSKYCRRTEFIQKKICDEII